MTSQSHPPLRAWEAGALGQQLVPVTFAATRRVGGKQTSSHDDARNIGEKIRGGPSVSQLERLQHGPITVIPFAGLPAAMVEHAKLQSLAEALNRRAKFPLD